MALIKCKECGKEISDTTDICIHCGAAIMKETKQYCPECNKEFDGKRCNNCGYSNLDKSTGSTTDKIRSFIQFIGGLIMVVFSIWVIIQIFAPPGFFGGTYVNRSTGAKIVLKMNSGKFIIDDKTTKITSCERYTDGGQDYIDLIFYDNSKWTCINSYDYIKCNGYVFNKK